MNRYGAAGFTTGAALMWAAGWQVTLWILGALAVSLAVCLLTGRAIHVADRKARR